MGCFYQINITVWVTFSNLTLSQNLNSIPLSTSVSEIQLRWQSCVRLWLQCTSTLSHVAAHQQPVSLIWYTFFVFFLFALSWSLLCTSAFWNRESTRNQLRGTVCHSHIKSNQFTPLRLRLPVNLWPHIGMCVHVKETKREACTEIPTKLKISAIYQ